MNVQDLLVIGLTIIALAALGYAIYTKIRAKRFTRERYAFAFLASSTGLFLVVITSLLAESPWIAFVNIIHQWLNNASDPVQAHWSEPVLVVLGFILIVRFQFQVWQNWSGGRSLELFLSITL